MRTKWRKIYSSARRLWNITLTENIMCKSTCLSFQVPLLWGGREAVTFEHTVVIVDVPEPTVQVIVKKLNYLKVEWSPEVPFMYVIHMYLLRHFWLTQTKRLKLNLFLYLYLSLPTDQAHLIHQIALIQVQITKLLAVYQMNVRVNLDLRLKRHWLVHQSKPLHMGRVSKPPKILDIYTDACRLAAE